MAIVYQKRLLYDVGGTPPWTSGSVTPNNTGNYFGFVNLTADGANENIQMTSSAGGTYTSQAQFNDPTPATWAYINCLACAAGAQTFTVTENSSGFVAIYYGFEYSGIASVSNCFITNNVAPGTGAGAILGVSVLVPTNSLLIAVCMEPINSETITAAAGTSRDSSVFNPSFIHVDYAGTGASIQPTFTTSANAGAGTNYLVFQIIAAPPAGGVPIAWVT